MANDSTNRRVLAVLARNQRMFQEEENYCRNIARELGLDRNTVRSSISFLEELGIVSRNREGQKKTALVNSSVLENMKLENSDDEDRPQLSDSFSVES